MASPIFQVFLLLAALVLVTYCSTFEDQSESGRADELQRKQRIISKRSPARNSPSPSSSNLILDFEVATDQTKFSITPASTGHSLSLSSDHHKGGSQSLKWMWPASSGSSRPKLTLDLSTNTMSARKGGIKFWVYRATKSPTSSMQITFVGTGRRRRAARSLATNVQLNFKGWRGVWIAYKEFSSAELNVRTLSSIEFKITSDNADALFLDLFQVTDSVKKQSRDDVVRAVAQQASSTFYNEKDFWQQSLSWYQKDEPAVPTTIPDSATKISDISKIEDRLENWFAKTSEALYSLQSTTVTGYDFQGAKVSRWDELLDDIKTANEKYDMIQFTSKLPTLFTKESKYGDEDVKNEADAKTKFGYMFAKVLLPLSIEYNFMSRDVEKRYLANTYCSILLTQTVATGMEAVQKIAGRSSDRQTEFVNLVNAAKTRPTDPLNCNTDNGRIASMEVVIDQLNQQRLGRIRTLLEFIIDQGWAEGSGLGSIDHQMNKAGSGFMNSMFLMRTALRNDSLFSTLVGAMKWYNDFNEIYQEEDSYVYDGTTADRMRTTLLYRLMLILIDDRDQNKQIQDMTYLQTWAKHAIRINKGLGGMIKPDYTGFHHKTYYGSAYVPHALHNAALVQYFLGGTSFALPQETTNNIRKALEVLRIVAVKYSTPNGISGRFPGYTKGTLLDHVPAYAYSCFVHSQGTASETLNKPEMFLRLFDTNNDDIKAYLEKGEIKSAIYYWNTIGSLDVFKKASTLTCNSNPPCTAESSPSGHWSKNFASLSIHRRGDWSVAVKGMNRYTWDYESSGSENLFGVFASHGSLQISNSEEDLSTYDIDNGWDWTRVPGTTSIRLTVDQTKTSKARNYNYQGQFAGGVNFKGSSTSGHAQHGAFGMYFVKPDYEMKKLENTPLDLATFEFKKSYFFYDKLIVCLGSDIKLGGVTDINTNYAQTTLFQDKLLDSTTSKIEIDSTPYDFASNANLNEQYQGSTAKELKDTNGNIYKIEPGQNTLVVEIKTQTSKKSNGKTSTTGNYTVAYLKHGTTSTTPSPSGKRNVIPDKSNTKKKKKLDMLKKKVSTNSHANDDDDEDYDSFYKKQTVSPQTSSYKYGIVIAGGNKALLEKYSILRQDSNVHAIKLTNLPNLGSQVQVYGYSVFNDFTSSPLTDGPVKSVNASCMIMAERDGTTLYLAISDPTIKFGDNAAMSGVDTCSATKTQGATYSPQTSTDINNKLLYCVEGKVSDSITVTLNAEVESIVSTMIDGQVSTENPPQLDTTMANNHKLIFSNLVNGFTFEVKLTLR